MKTAVIRGALAARFPLLLLLLLGCGPAVCAPITVQDDRGASVTFAQPPMRIVSLLPSLTETVCALGACDRLVAVDRYSNHPAAVRALPRAGGGLDPDLERVLALEPDVVLTDTVRARLPFPRGARIRVRAHDGRTGIAGLRTASADVVVLDAYLGGRVPPELTTTEFVADVARVLRPGGVLLANFADGPPLRYSRRAVRTVAEHLPEARMRPLEATYLAWLDLRAYGHDDPAAVCLERARVKLAPGHDYHPGSTGHVRLNIATSPERLTEIVHRMATALVQ